MTAARRLLDVQVVTAIDTSLGPVLPLYGMVQALKGQSRPGSGIWHNAKRTAHDIPPTYASRDANGRTTQCILPCDLTRALRVILSDDAINGLVVDYETLEALRQLARRSGADASYVDEFVATIQTAQQEQDAIRACLQLPEIVLGAGPLQLRVGLSSTGWPLGSMHDYLKWLQVDKDGAHSDWNYWIKEALQGAIAHASAREEESRPVIEYHKFNGIATPMGNIVAFRIATRLCANKSIIADELVDAALKLYTQKLAECASLPASARAFLRGRFVVKDDKVAPDTPPVQTPRALPEATVTWSELGAKRDDMVFAKRKFRELLLREMACEAIQVTAVECKRWTSGSSFPQRLRHLGEAALKTVREEATRAGACAIRLPGTKRKRQEAPLEEDPAYLRITEIAVAAGAWKPILRTYVYDLAASMVRLKSETTPYLKKRLVEMKPNVWKLIHTYFDTDEDWALAKRAVEETRDVYRRRVFEALEELRNPECNAASLADAAAAQLRLDQ